MSRDELVPASMVRPVDVTLAHGAFVAHKHFHVEGYAGAE